MLSMQSLLSSSVVILLKIIKATSSVIASPRERAAVFYGSPYCSSTLQFLYASVL